MMNENLIAICEKYGYNIPSVINVLINRYIKEILEDLSVTVPSLAVKVPTKLTMKQKNNEASGKPTSTSSPQPESSDFRMSHVSLSNAPNDEVCIAHGEPVSGDFKQFLENHPDMDFYDAKRKFKEEQKAKQKVRQGPKFSPP